jgi:lipoprotein-anchoring transpeptidase ErfK/SrfK
MIFKSIFLIITFFLSAANINSEPNNEYVYNLKINNNDTIILNSKIYNKIKSRFLLKKTSHIVIIDISEQNLYLIKNNKIIKVFKVSTSKYGVGNKNRSKKTPLGIHIICQKFGDSVPIGTIFKSLINTNKIAEIYYDSTDSDTDYVLTRILRLEGLEPGINRGDNISSYDRLIYIHGTHEEGLIGQPSSEGCIRMKNDDVFELYDILDKGTIVGIVF